MVLLLLLLSLSGKDEDLQATLKRALDFYRDNRDMIQLLAKGMNANTDSVAANAQPAPSEPNDRSEDKEKSQPEVDFNQSVLETFLRTRALS